MLPILTDKSWISWIYQWYVSQNGWYTPVNYHRHRGHLLYMIMWLCTPKKKNGCNWSCVTLKFRQPGPRSRPDHKRLVATKHTYWLPLVWFQLGPWFFDGPRTGLSNPITEHSHESIVVLCHCPWSLSSYWLFQCRVDEWVNTPAHHSLHPLKVLSQHH